MVISLEPGGIDMKFHKFSATGNDFILLDNLQRTLEAPLDPDLVKKLCARRTGIGADGILILHPSEQTDFKMEIINSDGTDGGMCANGARAMCYYADQFLRLQPNNQYEFETPYKKYKAKVEGNKVFLNMTDITDNQELQEKLSQHSILKNYQDIFYLEVGIPHLALSYDNLQEVQSINEMATPIRHLDIFSHGTNVNFFEITQDNHIYIRTFERGVEDETLSCGTGTVATALSIAKKNKWKNKVHVQSKGGHQVVEFDKNYENVFLIGTVQSVYEGTSHL